MMQVSKDLSIYAGGLGVNYTKTIVKFTSRGTFEENKLDCNIVAVPYLDPQKREVQMPSGRVGHQAAYSET